MNMRREHAFEMLLLIAALAVVQLPAEAPNSENSPSRPGNATTLADRAAQPLAGNRVPQRLDPLGLLQDEVPARWRVAIPSSPGPTTAARAC